MTQSVSMIVRTAIRPRSDPRMVRILSQDRFRLPRIPVWELKSGSPTVMKMRLLQGVIGEISSEPVVGWLVCIEGNHFGEDFKLKTGKNFIGRSSAMDVVLSGDASVSRDRHAIVVYEPKSNIFLVQPGDSKELFYVNDEVVLSAQKIKGYDVLSVGDSKLLFIPCCSDRFNWDAVKNEEK